MILYLVTIDIYQFYKIKLTFILDSENGISGGVEEVGNFKEGFCFKLQGIQNKSKFYWVVCSESYVL